MRATCKHCHKRFRAVRAGAQYCSSRCRTAAHRRRERPSPSAFWWDGGKSPRFTSRAELAERLLEIAESGDGGIPKTGRRYWYLALSHGYISPDMSDTPEGKRERAAAQKRVTDILGILRKQGELDWRMVLDLTRDLDQWQTYNSPREARAAMRRDYDEDRWLGQPYYPILIVEKDTLEPVCKPMANRWQMPFASSRGYGSLKLQHDVAEMLIRRHAMTGQSAVVYFVSDLDPSGLDLQRSWEVALSNFGAEVHEFVRIGLTPEQVELHDLDRLSIEVKPSDSRAKSFVAQYGRRCWEADVLSPTVIEEALDRDIRSWLDTKAWQQRETEIERARGLL